MIDVKGLLDIRRESPGEFYLAVITAAAVVAIGVEQGILLAIALSLFRHVRHSYNPHTMMLMPNETGRWVPMPAMPGKETEPGLIVYRFNSDLFYANASRFADEVRSLVKHAPTPVRWFIVDAGPITDIDYSAAQSLRDLLEELSHQGRRHHLRPCQSVPALRHGPAPDHDGDRRDAGFCDPARSPQSGA